MKRMTHSLPPARATTLMSQPNLALPVLIPNGLRFGSLKFPSDFAGSRLRRRASVSAGL
jgi:hypothetical protein